MTIENENGRNVPARTIASHFASALQARMNCAESGNSVWLGNHTRVLERLAREHMPSGSGVDNGTRFNVEESRPDRLVFEFGYHHMDSAGCYDGWTQHKAIVRPSLVHGFTLQITGRDKRDVKDYLGDLFHDALSHALPDSEWVALARDESN